MFQGVSTLKFGLRCNLRVIDSPKCNCGYKFENAEHFFLHCLTYQDIRVNLVNTITQFSPISLEIVLHGNQLLDYEHNILILDAVFEFIRLSGRFN